MPLSGKVEANSKPYSTIEATVPFPFGDPEELVGGLVYWRRRGAGGHHDDRGSDRLEAGRCRDGHGDSAAGIARILLFDLLRHRGLRMLHRNTVRFLHSRIERKLDFVPNRYISGGLVILCQVTTFQIAEVPDIVNRHVPSANFERPLTGSILINGVAPYFIYFVLHHQFQVAELPALLATSIPPLLDALVGIVRWRRIDFLAGFVLFTIGLAVGLVALGGDPRLYLIRESFITAGIGLAFILSNPLPRPLGFFFARYFMAGNDQARLAWVNDRWQRSAGFRHAIRFSNVVWGLGFVLEAAVRTYLVFTLSIERLPPFT